MIHSLAGGVFGWGVHSGPINNLSSHSKAQLLFAKSKYLPYSVIIDFSFHMFLVMDQIREFVL